MLTVGMSEPARMAFPITRQTGKQSNCGRPEQRFVLKDAVCQHHEHSERRETLHGNPGSRIQTPGLQPRRLFWRYLTTNPRALYLLFNKSRPSSTDRARSAAGLTGARRLKCQKAALETWS
jgi:hypothetical protein